MSQSYGKGSFVLGEVTVYKTGIVKKQWVDGPDRACVRIQMSKESDTAPLKAKRRIGFHFKDHRWPTWWKQLHTIAVEAFLQQHDHELRAAANRITCGGAVDTHSGVSRGSIPYIGTINK